jgi:hypothetical protein
LTGVELANEAAGTIISPSDPDGNAVRYSNMAFGQGMDVTMIQVAAAFSSIVNGGKYYKPTVLSGAVNESGKYVKNKVSAPSQSVSKSTADQVRAMAHEVRSAFLTSDKESKYYIGGKTGTSQVLENGVYSDTETIATYLGFGGIKLPDSGTLNRGFIGKIDESGKGIWVLPYLSEANTVGLTVTSEKEKVYAAGSFRNNISIGNHKAELKKNSHDSFIACISPNGTTEWIARLNLDTIPGTAPVAFSAKFNSSGNRLSMSKSVEDESFNGYGLFVVADGGLLYNGIVNRVFSSTPAKLETSYASAAVAATPELLKKQTDELIEDNADKGIAGLIAAVLLVKNMGATLSGNDARAALDKYNTSFSKQSPNIYKNLSKINFVKNSNGVISIQTEKGSDIYFDKIRVKNNSSININTTPSGDVSVDVLSGILVGKMVVWYKLNSVKLSKKSGDMVFDYDKDHSTAKVNMRKDILQ